MAQVETPTSFPESPLDQDEIIFPCKGCGDILEEGKAFELAGNRWHIDCFRCNTCGTLLDSDANLLLLGDGSLICNNCTYSCNACGNKIEDLAILTGDQAFCSSCFRCRNCKKKIENLRYARTSQGIFCMSCHESLMARRRKKARGAPKPSQNGSATAKEKALPSLPPGAATSSAFSPDMETPPSEAPSGTPAGRSPPERQYSNRLDMRSNSVKRDVSPMSDDALRDGPTLPASTYGESRPSNVSLETEDGDERGFLPMAFDPTPLSGPPPIARKVVPRAQDLSPPEKVDARARDYFGKTVNKDARRQEQHPPNSRTMSTEPDHERSGSQARASPHIFYQDKGRQQRKTSETNTPVINSATTSPLTATLQEQSDRTKVQQPETGSLAPRSNEGFKLQEAPKTRRTNSKTSPRLGSNPPVSPMDGSSKDAFADRPVAQSPVSTDSPNSSVNPFEDPKRQGNGPTSAAPSKQVDRPLRGDSLATSTRGAKAPTPETQTPTMASTQVPNANDRKESESSMPTAFVDAKTGLSRDNSRSKAIESPAMRTSFEAPPPPRSSSRQNAANKAIVGEDFTAPRAPPPPPPPATIERHRNNESIGSYDPPLSPSIRSAGLPKASLDGAFSMEEEMARILRGDSVKQRSGEHPSPSVLRKVSNAVKHGRSFSDRAIHGKSASNGAIEISSPMTISSPMLSSPSGKDTNEALAAQLRRAQQRIAYLETEVLRMEEKVDSSTEIKAANNELKEKRSTIVVLDSQREMVVRELEAMTEHLAKAKDSNQPLDMNSMKGHILKDFGEALQRLKDQMAAQIEDLIQKRNQLTEEIGNLIQMKDKGFQEYEVLSNKNAQLLEMNNQILHNIQDMYKSNKTGSGSSANGLGIYNGGGRDDAGSMAEMRNLNIINTDASMPNLLQEEAEPATVLTGPQVVNIRKGQPKKFNWRKGGEKMAKNVTKGIRGAFASDRIPGRDGEPPYSIGLPYNQTHQAIGGSELLAARPGLDGGKLGFFPQKGGLKPGGLGNMKDNSSTNLVLDPSVLFGSELEARCEYEKRVIPGIVSRCIEEVESRGIDMEGIYRKSGGSGQVKTIQQGFEKDNSYDISDPDLDIHAVTSTLKQYFRKLPTPLITYDVYDNLLEAGHIQDREKQSMALRMTVAELPEHHRDCLEFLVGHLSRVMANESENLMTPLNLAVVFAPTIMRPQSIEREMSDMQAQRIALQALLDHNAAIFPEA